MKLLFISSFQSGFILVSRLTFSVRNVSHYSQIDLAEAYFDQLLSQMKELRAKLLNVKRLTMLKVKEPALPNFFETSSAQRGEDLWLNNIFANIEVHRQIRYNMEQLQGFKEEINGIETILNENIPELNSQLILNKEQQEDMLISMSDESSN